ncbi:alpha-hydroxy-acid oxidizing protein [Clostridium intestinale]|uniref:alpha-hydroxy-acid oxidizing protein n=1 Tax=Clostridium intestinale TaxID=36845 RepID=UPI0028F0D0F1|nr:alpha-hydroxy-acid oxidizing protein [Clostridium intestinale]
MLYSEVLEKARTCIGDYCKACQECNGKACKNRIPGPGAKGIGDVAIRNYDKWKEIRINMDTLVGNKAVDTSVQLFNQKFKFPFFAGPVGAVNLHYGDKYNDMSYNNILVSSCAKHGILAFTGDGINPEVIKAATEAIKRENGIGIPTIKPWNHETILEKLKYAKESNAIAVAMDIDAAGLPFLKNMTPPAGSKSVEELKQIIEACDKPFIVKGIMTAQGALKAKQAGASAIVVSNHGGRVLDQCLSTAEVLKDIVDAVGHDIKIFVDGGIRSGGDVFKALAIGADGAIIARPFVTALYGGEEEGIQTYINKIGQELEETMTMCGAHSIDEITSEMISIPW